MDRNDYVEPPGAVRRQEGSHRPAAFGRSDALRRRSVVGTGVGLSALAGLFVAGCGPEQRPGSVRTIGGSSGSVSGSVSASVSAPPAAGQAPGSLTGDGIYTPVSNVAPHAAISLDVAEIGRLTNAVNEGKPLPADEIMAIYEQGKHSASGDGFRTLAGFARSEERAKEFAAAARFYGSPTFLDAPVVEAIRGTASAAAYSPGQRRQATQKGLQRILTYWVLHELLAAEAKVKDGSKDPNSGAPHNVDEAWAFYMGVPEDGKYPYALSATASSRESNFKREGTVDTPLREALARAQKASLEANLTAFQAADKEVRSRLNALFYLAAARYLNESFKSVQAGKMDSAPVQQIEGLSFYQTIQPAVAGADAAADQTIVDYYRSDPAKLTVERRDAALTALNKAADALLLKPTDRLSPADFA
ncbi:MAG: hypothetical protein ACRDI2_05200 [Chloroflexota bacterium]